MTKAKHAGLALLLVSAGPALAMEDLVAVSKTAMAITGDVKMDDFSITFANGRKLVFDELVGDKFVVGGKRVNASVYSIKTPSDPVLLNGNRLCGQGRVTYLATWGTRDTVIAVFTTQDVPDSDAAMCASYTYQNRVGATAAQAKAPMVGFFDAAYPACFSRSYSASHMAKHPKQRVSNIALIYTPTRSFPGQRPEKQWDDSSGTPMFFGTLAVSLDGERRTLLATVTCQSNRRGSGPVRCSVDEDGGSFTLTQTDNAIRLDNPKAFRVSPATGNHDRDMARSVSIDAYDDHAAFLLTATEQNPICETKWPEPKGR